MSAALALPRWSIAVATVTAALLLTGCTTGGQSDAGGDGSAAYTVEHAMGTTELPAQPERIVVLDSPHLDALVALGITPVGAAEATAGAGVPDYLSDQLAATESVGLIQEPNLESVARLAPDLIIGAKVRHEALYSQLTAIAPTVFSEGSGTNWREQATVTAAAVNRAQPMTELLDGITARANRIGTEAGVVGRSASIVRFMETGFRFYGPQTFSGSLLTEVGFDLGDRDWDEYSMVETSTELYQDIEADVVFHTTYAEGAASGTEAAVTGLWGSLPVVRAGNVHPVDDDVWMLGIGVLGAGRVLDDVEAGLRPVRG